AYGPGSTPSGRVEDPPPRKHISAALCASHHAVQLSDSGQDHGRAGLQAYNSLRAVIRGHKFILQALNAERQPPLRSAQGGLSAVHISPNPRCDDTVTIFRCILPSFSIIFKTRAMLVRSPIPTHPSSSKILPAVTFLSSHCGLRMSASRKFVFSAHGKRCKYTPNFDPFLKKEFPGPFGAI